MDDRNVQLPLKGKAVLVCEDSAIIALDCEALLVSLGASVVHIAATISQARALIDTHIDLALLDLNLNGNSALPLADDLRARGVPLIFVSGYTDILQTAERFATAQAIAKPYSVKDLADACRKALAGADR